jgi:hypothetical protein
LVKVVTFNRDGLGLSFSLHNDPLLLRFGNFLQPKLFGLGRFPDRVVEFSLAPLNLEIGDLDLLLPLDDVRLHRLFLDPLLKDRLLQKKKLLKKIWKKFILRIRQILNIIKLAACLTLL